MGKYLLVALLFVGAILSGQIPENISLQPGNLQSTSVKGSGILYFDGIPNSTPDVACCSELAINLRTGRLYYWWRDSTAWVPQMTSLQGYGVPNVPPADTTQRSYIDLSTGKWYYNPEGDSSWIEQGASGSGATVNEIASLGDTSTIVGPSQGDFAGDNSTFLAVYTGSKWLIIQGSAGSPAFDSARPILRTFANGVNIGGTTVSDVLEYMYFAPPIVTCALSPTTTVYEVGTSNAITVSGITTNSGGASLSNGTLTRTVPASATMTTFSAATSYSNPITYTPQQGGSGDYNELNYSFQATQDWTHSSGSGTTTSSTQSIQAVYPVLYLVSSVDYTSSTAGFYASASKVVETEGDKSISLTGSNAYIYYAVPKTWGDFDLSEIKDQNQFDVTSAFTAYDVTITSAGLASNWTAVAYKLYRLNNLTTVSNDTYTFNR